MARSGPARGRVPSLFAARVARTLVFACTLAAHWAAIGAQSPALQRPVQPDTLPPVISFPAGGVTLEEIVRLTIEHSPSVKLAESDAERAEGAVREQIGAFDYSLFGNLGLQHRVQQLPPSTIQSERDARTGLQQSIANEQTSVSTTSKLIDALKLPAGSDQTAAVSALSPDLGSELQMLDALIRNASDPSERSDLANERSSLVSDSIRSLQADLKDTSADLADDRLSLLHLGSVPNAEFFRDGAAGVELRKSFRNGISFSPFFNSAISSTNYVGKRISPDYGGEGIADFYTFNGGFRMAFPLARGRGRTVYGAPERAAMAERDATRLFADHQAEASALASAHAYWDLRAAEDALDAATRSEAFASRIADLTADLIRAGELPALELGRARAAQSRARSSLEDARRVVHQSQLALLTAVGVAPPPSAEGLPRTRDAFPDATTVTAPSAADAEALAGEALGRRHDLGAARKLEEAGRIREVAAEGSVAPRLDLTLGTWITSTGESNFRRAANRWAGPSGNVGLTYERPIGNNQQLGLLAQQQADRRLRQISADDLARQLRLDILTTVRTLGDAVEGVKHAESAATLYASVVEGEIERFRAGESTLIDTLLTQQEFTDALNDVAAARRELWRLVVDLRYQTGTLLEGRHVVGAALVSLPSPGAR